jgi:hypothetical protein
MTGFYRNLLDKNMSKASFNVQAVSNESEEPASSVSESKEEIAEGELKANVEQESRHGNMRPRKRKDMEGKQRHVSVEDENNNQKRIEDQARTESQSLERSSVVEERAPPSQTEEQKSESNVTEVVKRSETSNPSKIERRNTDNSVAAARERYLARKLAAAKSQNQ